MHHNLHQMMASHFGLDKKVSCMLALSSVKCRYGKFWFFEDHGCTFCSINVEYTEKMLYNSLL